MFRNDIEAALERARIAEDQLRRLEAKDEKSQAELDELRAALEAQRAELARLRRVSGETAPAGAPRGRGAILVAASLLVTAGAVAGFLMVRSDAPPPSLAAAPASVPARAHTPAVARDPAPAPLSEEIGDAALAAILTAHTWRGSGVEGQLRFARSGDGLVATLTSDDGAHSLKVQLGRMATLTLELGTTRDGQSLTTTYHGALCSDRRTIRGTLERVLRNGEHENREQGVFTLTAAR